MHVGVISDIHGNWPALEAVLADLPDVDSLLCAGDIVGYNPWPSTCVDHVRSLDISCISGNHDRAVVQPNGGFRFNAQAQAAIEHARSELDADQRDWLAGLPTMRSLIDGRIRLVHGHPTDPDRYTFPAEFGPDLLEEEELLVMGHTHIQHVETYASGIVLNPGSVGQPRDGDPRAAYAVVDLADHAVELQRVEYDIDRVQEAIADAGLPRGLGDRLITGR